MNTKKPIKDYVFVIAQLLIFVAYFLPIHFPIIELPEWLRYSGMFILGTALLFGVGALLQLNTHLSPFPSPVASGKLITNGTFRISRHPIYTALIFSGFGHAVYQQSMYKLMITLIILVLFYFKSRYEEYLLNSKFSEYKKYKKRTRRFI